MTASRWIAALLCSGILAAVHVGDAWAQGTEKGVFGLGLILGEPTGISGKLYLGDDTAVAGAIGTAFVSGGIHVHADFLWHPWVLEDREGFVMPAYLGGGARVLNHRGAAESDFHLGGRGVAGILFDFKDVPLDVFVEAALVLDYVLADDPEHDGFGLDVNAGAGVRYYF